MKLTLLRHLSFACIMAALVTGCSKESDPQPLDPVSCFELPKTSPKANETIVFSSCSKNSTSWLWEFGDGATSTLENPEHKYTTAGNYTVKLTVKDDRNGTHTSSHVLTVVMADGTPASECTVHSGFITQDQTWGKGCHIVRRWVEIEDGATLTIAPGAVVKFEDAGYLGVSSDANAALIAEGTEAEPIIFTSAKATPAPGDWDRLAFNGLPTLSSSLKHCIIEYGGYDLFDDPAAMVHIQDKSRVKIDNCEFSKSYSYALATDSESGFEVFTNNYIHDVDEFAIHISGNYAGTIGEGNVIENKGVLIRASSVDMDTEWRGLTCPYVTESNLWVGSATGNTLTLGAGVRIEFQREQMLLPAFTTSIATLITNGTAENPVVLTVHDPNELRRWGGIKLSNQFTADSYFRHTIFEQAQSSASQSSIIAVGATTLNMENCSISGAKAYGIYMGPGATLGTFRNNDFGPLATYSMYIQMQNLTQIADNTFSGGKDVHVGFHHLTTDVVFPGLPVYYYIAGDLWLGSETGNTVTFSPGSKFLMAARTIMVGQSSHSGSGTAPTTFRAVGTAGNPIIIKRVDTPSTSGDVVDFSGTKIHPESIMEHCQISGGSIGIRVSNVYNDVANRFPTIRNNNISGCSKYAIIVMNANPNIEDNNTYTDNGFNGVHVIQ